MKKSFVIEIIAYLFTILFLYTGISKLMDHTVFREQLAVSPVLQPFASWMAWALPLAELVIAVMLFIPVWRLKGLYATLSMMILFTIYIGAILLFDDRLPCSCGGVIEFLSWPQHLILNGLLILTATTGIVLSRRTPQTFKTTISM